MTREDYINKLKQILLDSIKDHRSGKVFRIHIEKLKQIVELFHQLLNEKELDMEKLNIKIKYKDNELERLNKLSIGDWIDLRCAETIVLRPGDFKLVPLGIAMALPEGYEAHVLPRSSTFKNFGIIQTNSMGIIDCSYCGDNDWWFLPVYATRDMIIRKNDRIAQFRIVRNQPRIEFEEVDILGNEDRGGHGSTGVN